MMIIFVIEPGDYESAKLRHYAAQHRLEVKFVAATDTARAKGIIEVPDWAPRTAGMILNSLDESGIDAYLDETESQVQV